MREKFFGSIKSTLFALYVLGFIFTFSSSLPAYISSSFLAGISSEQITGIVYILCAVFTLIVFLSAPKILRRFGNYRVTMVLLFANTLSLVGVAWLRNVWSIFACFIIAYVSSTIASFCFDIFVEHDSRVNDTGEVRSRYLTAGNIAWLLSPWLSGVLIGAGAYGKIFLVAGMSIVPVMLIVAAVLSRFPDPEYKELHFVEASRDVWKNPDLLNIFTLNFLLQFFFAWMIIYTPLYLHMYVGFSWQQIGIMFTIMLVPFVFLQVPAGELADKKYGEKEMLTISFIIMGISVALIPLIGDKSFLIWTILLFVTRIGAALAQVMCDTYLFKRVVDADVGIIDLYRTMSPLANIVAPLFAIGLFLFFPFSSMFFVLGFLMLCGLKYSLTLRDTL